jgi:O-acetyl-ADP-ribose deacetylase (regulator of RNase III)
MKYITGNLFEYSTHGYLCIPTNGDVKNNGRLVMGEGVALLSAAIYRKFPDILGDHVSKNGNIPYLCEYYKLISWPTKHHWYDKKSDINLLLSSMYKIIELVTQKGISEVYLPKVGCGAGGLSWEHDVKPELENKLDNRFTLVCV